MWWHVSNHRKLTDTETKMSSFWRNFHHWLHWKLSFWQLSVQPMMKISSKWRHFRFSGIPLCLAMWNIVIDRMQLRQNRTRCLNITYFSYSHPMHFSTKKSANLTKRHAIAVKLLLVLNDAHNPINNPTVQITDPRKPNTLLPGNSTTDRISVPSHTTMEIYVLITMRHHFSNKFLEELWKEPCFARFDKYSTFDFTALCSNASAVSVNTWTWKPYFKITCVKSVLWPALINNVVNV